MFVKSQSGIKGWESLKNALIDEFGEILTASEIHRVLRNRRKRQNESYREYLYALMEIGRPINLDVASLLDYFIEGIPDSRFNKSVLYQAKTVEQMKEQIKIYEKVCNSDKHYRKNSSPSEVKVDVKEEIINIKKKNCFKCGSTDHLARNCGENQFKCFKCNGFGHRAADCDANKRELKREPESNVNTVSYDKEPSEPGLMFKKFRLDEVELCGLVDTGSNISIIRSDIYGKLQHVFKLTPEQRRLKGAGAAVFYTQGYFDGAIVVDSLELKIRLHVVRTEDISYPAVLGTNLLQFADFFISEKGVKIVSKTVNGIEGEINAFEVEDRNDVEENSCKVDNVALVSTVRCQLFDGSTRCKGKNGMLTSIGKEEQPQRDNNRIKCEIEQLDHNRRITKKRTKSYSKRDTVGERRQERNYETVDRFDKKSTQYNPSSSRKGKCYCSYRDRDNRNEVGKVEIQKRCEDMKGLLPVFESNTPSGGPNVGFGISDRPHYGLIWNSMEQNDRCIDDNRMKRDDYME